MADETIWGIHGGRTGDADSLFLQENCVAVGWKDIGDLSRISATREAFKAVVAEHYPGKKPGAVPNNAGQLIRFVHEVQKGHLVVYPSKQDRQVHIGRITGDYAYDPTKNPTYPNLRSVNWLKSLPRTSFSQGALYEIGSALSLFQVKNYADEFRSALEDTPVPVPVNKDESVAVVVEEIEENTRDFILKTIAQELKGHGFATFVAERLDTIQAFEHILFDSDWKKRLLERTQLHRLLVHELWLFGEEYSLGTDDDGLRDVLRKHVTLFGRDELAPKADVKLIDGKHGIPDLMLYRRRNVDRDQFEHLVVELKRPRDAVGDEELSQIRKYAISVGEDQRFDTRNCRWEFVLMANALDKVARPQVAQQGLPEGCLYRSANVTVWVRTWADLLGAARTRYEF